MRASGRINSWVWEDALGRGGKHECSPVPMSSRPQGIQPAVLRLKAPVRPSLWMKKATNTGPRPAGTESMRRALPGQACQGEQQVGTPAEAWPGRFFPARQAQQRHMQPPAATLTLAQVVHGGLYGQRHAALLGLVHVQDHGPAGWEERRD